MNIKLVMKGLILLLLLSSQVSAQGPAPVFPPKTRTCHTQVPPPEWDAWFNARVQEQKQHSAAFKQQEASSFTIPVIVHVIHGGEQRGTYPNLTQEQINSQIVALNEDFSGNGYNVFKLPNAFAGAKANCAITFVMTQLDENGNPLQEPGIDRVDWHTLGSGCSPYLPANSSTFQTFFDDSIKPKTIWDPRYFFNIWVSEVKSTVDLLGYATFPVGTNLSGIFNGNGGALDDGVWIWASAFGTVGTLHQQYDHGRTATHEIGHWLGLRHIWGDIGCGDDYCDDTPKQQTSNLNCPTYPKTSCNNGPNGEMFMNFMDYCDDECLYMYTWDQTERMHTAMNFGTFRKELTASSVSLTNLPTQEPDVAFTVTNSACANVPVTVQNQSTGMPWPFSTWKVEPSGGFMVFPASYGEQPVFVFTEPGLYSITLTGSNSIGSASSSVQVEISDCGIPAGLTESAKQLTFDISPNPSGGLVEVSGDFHLNREVGVELYNMLGDRVFSRIYNPGAITLNLGELPEGVYFTTIQQDNNRVVKKLILSR